MTTQQSWLPNLVAGVSIWKLAVDLNAPGFMDGRLLEPETEGNDSLPSSVSWDLTGLIPLSEARRDHGEAADKALGEFFACLEQVRAQFDNPESGYHQYHEAFTLPAIDSEEEHYFYSPERARVYVINWGASPRTMQQDQAYLFGHQGFEDLYKQVGVAPVAAAVGGAAVGAAAGAAVADAAGAAEGAADKALEKKKDEKKKKPDEEGRPWWMWALLVLAAIAILMLLLFLFKECNDEALDDPDAGTDNALSGGGAGGNGGASAMAASGGNSAQGGASGSGGAAGDSGSGGKGAGGNAGDSGAGGKGAGGGSAGQGGSGDDGGGAGDSSGSGSAGTAGGVVGDGDVVVINPDSSGSGGDVIIPLPDLAASGQAHRSHTHPNAQAWRVSSGRQHVSRTVLVGRTYHVVLKRGARFEQIRVQWRDSQGVWHDH